jgi:hypothetical protein
MHILIIKAHNRIGTGHEWLELLTGMVGTNDRTHWEKLPGISRRQGVSPIDFFQVLFTSDITTAQAALYRNSS